MGIFRQFPYSNFHEMNMDELIKIIRKIQDEWSNTKNEWSSYKNFIDNYFKNLDVSDEVLAALRRLAADGTLSTLMDPVIATKTAEWLQNNITATEGETVIDKSLSIAGAAADAAITGGRSNFHDGTFITLDDGIYYPITNLHIDITAPQTGSGWSSKVVQCTEGDMFYIKMRAVASPSAYAFINSAGAVLDRDYNTEVVLDHLQLIAPENATHLVVNNNVAFNTTPILYKSNTNVKQMNTVKYENIPKRYYSATGGKIIISSPSHNTGWSSRLFKCAEGDTIYVSAKAVTNPATVYFIDSAGNIIQQTQSHTQDQPLVDFKLTAPYKTAYCVVNNFTNFYSTPVTYHVKKPNVAIVDKSGDGMFTSLTEAIAVTSGDILVKPGDYDIVAEYKAYFGENIFNQISDSYTGIGMFTYGLYLNNRTVTFETGAKVFCDLNGVLTVDSTHRFSPFNLASNAHIIGLYCNANGTFYLIHDDYGEVENHYTNSIENCILTGNMTNHNIIGGGTRIYSTNIVKNCYMNNYEPNSETMRYHNYNNANSQPKVIVEGCRTNGSIGARYYGTQTNKRMVFIAHNNSTGSGVIKRAEGSATVDNVTLLTWANVIE